MKWFCVSMMVLVLAGCSGAATLMSPPSLLKAPLSASDMGGATGTIIADHYFKFEKGETHHNLIMHSEINANSVSLVGLSALGGAVFECRAQGGVQSCDVMSDAIPAEQLFENMQMVFAPFSSLQNHMTPSGFTVVEVEHKRLIGRSGKPVIEISYSGADIWNSNILFDKKAYGYQFTLKPLYLERSPHAE